MRVDYIHQTNSVIGTSIEVLRAALKMKEEECLRLRRLIQHLEAVGSTGALPTDPIPADLDQQAIADES